jgi:hypothetical protein
VHPFYGSYDNIVCREFTLDENMTELGEAKISITFEFSEFTGLPSPSDKTPATIADQKEIVAKTIWDSIINWLETNGAAGGTALDAAAKLTTLSGLMEKVSRSTTLSSPIDTDKFNEYQLSLSNFNTRVNELVANPTDLGEALSGLYSELDGIYTSPADSYRAMTGLFDYGDDDIKYEGAPTALTLQRQSNRDLFNNSNRSYALSYAYLEASQLEYVTVEDIEVVTEQLEDQYQLLLNGQAVDRDVLDEVTEQRSDTIELLSEQKITARRTTVIPYLQLTTSRLVAYKYYEDSADGERLARMNNRNTMVLVGQDVEVLTP